MAAGILAQPGTIAAVGAAMALCAAAGISYITSVSSRERVLRTRIDAFVPRAGGRKDTKDRKADTRRKQINSKMKALQEGKRHGASRIGAVRVLIMRAGLTLTITQFWGACLLVGMACSGLWILNKMEPLGTPVVFVVTTVLLPQLVLRVISGRRQKEFTKYFASAIDIIVRGLKSGLPVQECFRIIGREMPDPCGSEFRTVIDEVNAGLTVEDALDRSYQRMPTQELRFFATVIAVQAQTGGNLAEILGNISGVLRGRAALKEKIKALSSEAKMSSIIVGALPFFVGGILTMVNYAYVSLLWTTHTGKIVLAGAMCSMSMGMFIMNRMGKLDM